MFLLIIFLKIGACLGILENGFQDYSVVLKEQEVQTVNFTKSMFDGSTIKYTINCMPGDTSFKPKFGVTVSLYHNYCHVPRIKFPLSVTRFENIPCTKNLLSTLRTTKVLKLINKTVSANNNTSNTQVDNHSHGLVGDNFMWTNKTGLYVVILEFHSPSPMTIKGRIESTHKGSYLSALTYPLLPFYGVMSLAYLAYAIGWLIAACCNWKDLLKAQFWIGGVIALGIFENALFYSEYKNISHSGKANGLLYFAEIVSCAKRALARILVVIVSIGFGIVKPRLSQTLHKVILVGVAYFILAAVEGCLRVKDEKELLTKKQMFVLIALTVFDVSIWWWIFTSLVQTTRTLRIRKNIVKLTLYRHFTNTLIFTVLVFLAYMIYLVKENKFDQCVGMKMRNKSETTAKNRKSADDDLRWVEENIPSVPSTLLPTIDSDEIST